MRACPVCSADLKFLRTADRPEYEALPSRIRLADLFCGGGGLSLGVAEAARRLGRGTEVALAVERDAHAADVYRLNFPDAHLVRADICELFDGELGARATQTERGERQRIGDVDVLVAGPPCQGHSDLNNHTRRRDPRNALYLRAVRAAEILRPPFVVLENVPAIERDEGGVVNVAIDALEGVGYTVDASILDLVRFGVPQRRRRHILVAALGNLVEPSVILDSASPCSQHPARTVAWAIKDLLATSGEARLDTPSVPTSQNRRRMEWLLKNGKYDLPNRLRPKCHHGSHSYTSMYGRLSWDDPAQTITTGYGSMGQGRFVHPAQARTLTAHEAARLQTLPDFFDLDETKGPGAWAAIIGNAVPPLLAVHIIEPLLCALAGAHGLASVRTMKRVASNGNARRQSAPPASSDRIRLRMTTTKRRETAPELAIRSELHRLGYRYRVDRAIDGMRGRVDIVFPRDRVAVYVDGCFWHSCPVHGTLPKQNHQWWVAKLEANKQRDSRADERLREIGWEVLRFWEHENPIASASHVDRVLVARRLNGSG